MLKTSLLITGDSAGAVQAANDAATGIQDVGTAARAATPQVEALDQAQRQTAKSADAVVGGHARMSSSGAIMQHVVRSTTDSFVAGLPISMIFGEQVGRIGEAAALAGGGMGKFGAILAGPWGIAITAAVSIAGVLVGKLLEGNDAAKEQAKALQEALTAADSYGNAQTLLGKVVDLTTGKIKTQNLALIEQVKLIATSNIVNAQKEGREARERLSGYGKPTFGQRVLDAFGDANSVEAGQGTVASDTRRAGLAPLQQFLDTYNLVARSNASPADLDRALQAGLRGIDAAAKGKKLNGADPIDVKQAFITIATSRNTEVANQEVLDFFKTGKLAASLKPYERPKVTKDRAAKSTDGLERYGDEAATRIADIVGQYNSDPSFAALEKTNKQVRALDDLIAQLGRRKPPGFEDMIASAEKAKTVVREGIVAELAKAFDKPRTLADQAKAAFAQIDVIEADLRKNKPEGFEAVIASAEKARVAIAEGLQRPYADYLKSQQDGLAVLQLQAQGRNDEAEALRQIQSLEKTMGPLTLDQRDAVLATVQALRAEQHEVDALRERNAKYLEALGGIRGVVEDATQAFARGEIGQLIKTPGKLLDVVQTLNGRAFFDKLFGGLFSQLEDQVNGTSVVKDASTKVAGALELVGHKADATVGGLQNFQAGSATATSALIELATAARGAAGAIAGSPAAANDNGDIVVTGSRLPATLAGAGAPALSVAGMQLVNDPRIAAALGTGGFTTDPSKLITQALSGIGTSIAKAFTDPKTAEGIGKAFGKYGGQALQGAAEGQAVSGIAKAIGIKQSELGAQIGGAIGSFAGPIGAAVGGFLGGTLGGLFQKTKYGGATITSAGVQGTVGNDEKEKAAAVQTGNAVLSTLAQIATSLGGTPTGDFGTITIGQYKDKFRINDHGTDLKSNNDVLQYDTLEEAQHQALAVALQRGAIQGISAAVQKALTDPNVDGPTVAVAVSALETQLGGVTATLKKLFDTEAASAKERLKLAQTYGLDIAATEKANADSMAKLMASTLKTAVGSLQSVLDDMATGDLFEGSAADRRSALLTKIGDARTRADAGEDGAADELATLYRNLLSTSKDAYGTAGGEYSADRSTVSSGAAAVIKAEQDRINQAANVQASIATNTAKTAELTDESNDLLATISDRLASLGGVAGIGATGGDVVPDFRLTKVGG